MIVSRDDSSSNITLFNSALADDVTYSPLYLVAYYSLAICSFSSIKNITLELVALTYAFVALSNVVGCLCTSDMITRSSNHARDMWTSRVGTLRDYTTLCVVTCRKICCASPPLDCLQGFMCLLDRLGLALLPDLVKSLG